MGAQVKTFVLREENNAKALWGFLKSNWVPMAQAGKPLSVFVAEHKAKRSHPQNKLYWALLAQIAEQTWLNGKQFSTEAWHEMFKRKFIGHEETPDGGTVGISTTTLSVPEFSIYIERVQQYAAEELDCELI